MRNKPRKQSYNTRLVKASLKKIGVKKAYVRRPAKPRKASS